MRTTVLDIQAMKRRGQKIPMITAYDYTSAQIVDRAGIPMILVGDSLGMVVLGYPSTVHVTLDDMVRHSRAVVRGTVGALVVADLPFLTYSNSNQALQSAGRLLRDAGVQAVKLEGGAHVASTIRHLVEYGIPVMGHLGLTPQSVHQLGTRVQGRRASDARQLIEDALAVEAAGAFAVVLELVPLELAGEITGRLSIPTVGIGAGPRCDGQVQVWHDLLGLYTDFLPRHTRRYAPLSETITAALQLYAHDVRSEIFPSVEHGSVMDEQELQEAIRQLELGA